MLPGGAPRSITLAAVLLFAPGQFAQSDGAYYYVSLQGDDRNPGTQERPWRHVEWAATRPFLRGGDVIRIRSGVYRPQLEQNPHRDSVTDDTLIRPVASGRPGRPITMMAEPGESVVVSGRLAAANWVAAGNGTYYYDYSRPQTYPYDDPFQVVEDGRLLYRVASLDGLDQPGRCFVDTATRRIFIRTSDGQPPSAHLLEYGLSISGIEFRNGVGHWRLAGLAVVGFRTSGLVIVGKAGHIELDRMDISYIGAHRPGADFSNGWALAVQDTAGGNYVHDSRLHHTLAEAVHISQTGAGEDLYENNDIADAGGAVWFHQGHAGRILTGPGMILRGNRVTVRGNRFLANGYHGLILESDLLGSEGPASPSQNVIEGNVFAFNAGGGIYADGKNGLTPSIGNLIRFNLLDRNNRARGGGGDAELRVVGNFDDTLIYNNTVYADSAIAVLLYGSRVAGGGAQGADAAPDRLRLLNNIVVQAGSDRSAQALRAADLGAEPVLDANNWRQAGAGALVSWNGVEYASLEAFRRLSAQEGRGWSTDPRFVSVPLGHFWLRSVSPLLARGVGDVRGDGTVWAAPPEGSPPDLGAFPYRPLLAVTPADLRFGAVSGGRDPAPQTLTVESAAGPLLSWAARSGAPSWLRLSTSEGQTPARLAVSVRASGLPPGLHTAQLEIAPAVEAEPALVVPVSLAVAPAPPRRRN